MRTKIYRFFQPISKRFLLDFPPIWDPKISKSQPKSHAKSKQQKSLKNDTKNLDFGLQNGLLFWRFWLPKSTLGGALGPSGRPNRKSPPKLAKNHPSYEKMTLKWSKKITQVMKKCFKNDLKSIPKRWKKHQATSNLVSRNLVI